MARQKLTVREYFAHHPILMLLVIVVVLLLLAATAALLRAGDFDDLELCRDHLFL